MTHGSSDCSRAMCHTAVAQLDTSYPAVHPVMAIAQSPASRLKSKRLNSWITYTYVKLQSTGSLSETNSNSFVPFPDVRNCAPGPPNPKRDSDSAFKSTR